MFESLVDLASGSAWTYGLVFALAALDVLVPIVPSESLLVAAAALSASGRLDVFLVAGAAAAGALLGDNVAFFCGRLLDTRMRRWLEATPRRRERLEWAEHQLDRRGGTIIIGARFIPGGRTVTMLAAGLLEMPWRRFVAFDIAAAVIWALYGTAIGYFGGTAFEDEPVIGIGVALALALVAGAVIEVGRRLVGRLRSASGDA
ncbi:MAG TPA: DedA family protein [Gaiellales bacterium]|jgi:membrane protein DedA with SNARE-associated domain|nr:DedA family protein [Gaiellales bacterium]